MTTQVMRSQHMTFEDLKGLRAEGYVRESSRDQKDGFGPEVQRKAIEGFARAWRLSMGQAWYTDIVTGRSTLKRSSFHAFLADAKLDRFDVLLVFHTSRFARNRADAIRCKAELRKLGKTVVFVSQGIISGAERDFLNEGINEVLDEYYSITLSKWVAGGLKAKHDEGIANGVPPLGYKSEKLDNGKRERKVLDSASMPALLALLRSYSSGKHSYYTLAEHLNAEGHRNREGEPFTKGSVEHVLSNRFYEGNAVYHPGEPDEEVRKGTHEVPAEVKELWFKCQEVKRRRATREGGRPRSERRAYPFSRVAVCDSCGRHYSGQPVHRDSGKVIRRLYHSRPFCSLKPHSVRVERLAAQFYEGVLPYMTLGMDWKETILNALRREAQPECHPQELCEIERALVNLRKQHLWGDLTDDEYRRQRQELERRSRALVPAGQSASVPDLDRAARVLSDLPGLWQHPGVTDEQREGFISDVFDEVRLNGGSLLSIKPKQEYAPLFAYVVTEGVRNGRGEWI